MNQNQINPIDVFLSLAFSLNFLFDCLYVLLLNFKLVDYFALSEYSIKMCMYVCVLCMCYVLCAMCYVLCGYVYMLYIVIVTLVVYVNNVITYLLNSLIVTVLMFYLI